MRSILFFYTCLFAGLTSAHAQVAVTNEADAVVVENLGFDALRLVRAPAFLAAKNGGAEWMVADNVGNLYPAGGYLDGDGTTTGGGGEAEPEEEAVIIVGGYQKVSDTVSGGGTTSDEGGEAEDIIVGGYQDGETTSKEGSGTTSSGGTTSGGGTSSEEEEEEDVVTGGYQDALDVLRAKGGVVEHDSTLGVDIISFPEQTSPIDFFFELLERERVRGRRMGEFFRLIELSTRGRFVPEAYEPADPLGMQLVFPNDPFYQNQWNLRWSRLAPAQWHPAQPRKAVRVGLIDSGIGEAERLHEGLDGTRVVHEPVAPTTGRPASHALGLATLLTDRAQDKSGVIGLLGDAWDSQGCQTDAALMSKQPPTLHSYNVGDYYPGSVYVARAIRRSIEQEVDVINLSLAMAYSPLVVEAIREAQARNILVVAAAGNYAPEAEAKPTMFPANLPGVIAVGASTRSFQPSASTAIDGVDLFAPGEQIVVGGTGGLWREVTGTSYAAPHVTATLAMMRAVRPDLTHDEALEAFQERGIPLLFEPASSDTSGAWSIREVFMLNALSALNHVLPQEEREQWILPPHFCQLNFVYAGKTTMAGDPLDLWGMPGDGYVYDDAIDADLFRTAAAPAELPDVPVRLESYPNPFNPQTTLRFEVPEAGPVSLVVYNLLGQPVRVLADGPAEAGVFERAFDATGLPSGVYLARLTTPSGTAVRRLTLLR